MVSNNMILWGFSHSRKNNCFLWAFTDTRVVLSWKFHSRKPSYQAFTCGAAMYTQLIHTLSWAATCSHQYLNICTIWCRVHMWFVMYTLLRMEHSVKNHLIHSCVVISHVTGLTNQSCSSPHGKYSFCHHIDITWSRGEGWMNVLWYGYKHLILFPDSEFTPMVWEWD